MTAKFDNSLPRQGGDLSLFRASFGSARREHKRALLAVSVLWPVDRPDRCLHEQRLTEIRTIQPTHQLTDRKMLIQVASVDTLVAFAERWAL